MSYSEFRCPACNLFFSADLTQAEVLHCPLCGYMTPEPVMLTPVKHLCVECHGERKTVSPAELEQQYYQEMMAILNEPDPSVKPPS